VNGGVCLRELDPNQNSAANGHLLLPGEFLFGETPMMDAVMMAIVFVFFALSIAYCYACDRL
jgi:hypothetical protein